MVKTDYQAIPGIRLSSLQIVAGVLLFFFWGSPGAGASCMNCISKTGNSYTELACEGDSKFDVIRKCGKPDYEETTAQVTTGQYGSEREKGSKQGGFSSSTETIDTLYYNCGVGRFVKILTFRGGILIKVEEGDRGSGEQKCW
jgi:hypothetical protein